MSDPTGLELAHGTYEDALAMVGATTPVFRGVTTVCEPRIRLFCALTEDANPSYWDHETGAAIWGSIVSPPGMIPVWTIPLPWQPTGAEKLPLMLSAVPLPGDTLINASTDTEFLAPVVVGDRLSVTDELIDVSPLKETSRGPGHFITTRMTYRNQREEVVARYTNVMFRYTSPEVEGP